MVVVWLIMFYVEKKILIYCIHSVLLQQLFIYCLVAFVIKIPNGNYKPTKESCNRRMNFKYQWDDEHKVQFLSNLNTEDMCTKFIDLFNESDTDLSSNDVNNLVSDFSAIITKCADPFFDKTISIKATDSLKRGEPDWVTDECTQLKHDFLNMLNQHHISKSDDSRTKLVKARNRYTTCAKQCRLKFDQAKTQQLINAETSNARDF